MKQIAIIGAGPGGLMMAERLALLPGLVVTVYDSMPSAGRKFLQAGRGGLNLTHSEDKALFVTRYGARQAEITPWLQRFSPQDLRDWVQTLGFSTFVGSSGRVYPDDMKAAPLLRAWLSRLRGQGVRFAMHHRWQGWDAQGALQFDTASGAKRIQADAVVLALGGASWPHLGSDGRWTDYFVPQELSPFQPSNCGFDQAWSDLFKTRFAGSALKSVVLYVDAHHQAWSKQGECLITEQGLEGSLIYALSAPIREALRQHGQVAAALDLMPMISEADLRAKLTRAQGKQSWSNHLKRAGVDSLRAHLLREQLPPTALQDYAQLAKLLKRYPLNLTRPRPLAEAISTAGGMRFDALLPNGMLASHPGVWCVGEMLDWEAPTGGYLLTAVMASAVYYADKVQAWLSTH